MKDHTLTFIAAIAAGVGVGLGMLASDDVARALYFGAAAFAGIMALLFGIRAIVWDSWDQ